jgi:heptosyltransferase-2
MLPKLTVPPALTPKEILRVENLVTIAPGSAWETKKWPWAYYAEVGKKLIGEGKIVAIIGGRADAETAHKIENSIDDKRVINFAGKLTLLESASVISRSKLLISNDSSPVHIATAVGTRSVVLFGPTVPAFGFAPPPVLGRVVELEGLWCRPCTSHGSRECPTHTHECMKGILPDTVFHLSNELLA